MPVKRTAPSSTSREHPSKKRVIAKSSSVSKKPLSNSNAREKSRRKPVTAAEEEDDELASSEDENDDFPETVLDELVVDQEDDAMETEQENVPIKDPNGMFCTRRVRSAWNECSTWIF